MKSAIRVFTAAAVLVASTVIAQEFPLRAKYPGLIPISTADLAKEIGKSLVIDVRSDFEFSVMHIDGARHVDLDGSDFIAKLTSEAGGDKSRGIITYCNGITCEKSYEAAMDATNHGFTAVRVYDAGVLEWARMARGRTLLFGKPVAPEALISETQYKAHVLAAATFISGAASPDVLLIDVRDQQQRKWTAEFAQPAERVTIDRLAKQLDTPSFRSKAERKTLYIFDNVGKQVRWLQYALKTNGYERYFFLENGMEALRGALP